MAFIESPRFPDYISYGSEGGPSYSTQVDSIQSGYEARNQNWSVARYEYNVGVGVRGMDDLEALTSFFHEARGKFNTFRFKDWGDFTATSQNAVGRVLLVDGVLRLAKVYGSTSPYNRLITKPVSGTIVVAGSSSGFTLDYTTGVITGASANDVWTGEFDVPVRFDQDELPTNLESFEVGSASVNLIEVRN